MFSLIVGLAVGFGVAIVVIPFLMYALYRKKVGGDWGIELSSSDLDLSLQALEILQKTPLDSDPYQVLAAKGGLSPTVKQALIPVVREMSPQLARAWSMGDSAVGVNLAREIVAFKKKIPFVTVVFGLIFSFFAYLALSLDS